MTTHYLKCWPEIFDAVGACRKTFEVRKNDRGYQTGDLLVLRKWSPHGATPGYIKGSWRCPADEAEAVRVRVTYVLSGMGIEPGFVCMGIKLEAADG